MPMFRLSFALAALLLTPSAMAQEPPRACPPPPDGLRIDWMLGPVAIDHSRSRAEIAVLAQSTQRDGPAPLAGLAAAHAADPRRMMMGLTTSGLHFDIDSLSKVIRRETGGRLWACPQLTAMTVHFGFEQMRVFIDSRYPAGSCQAREIEAHEMTHVAIYRDTLARWRPLIEQGLRQAYAMPVAPLEGGVDDAVVRQAPGIMMRRHVAAVVAGFQAELQSRNADLDSDASYESSKRQCPRW